MNFRNLVEWAFALPTTSESVLAKTAPALIASLLALLALLAFWSTPALADSAELAELRHQLTEQRALLQQQQAQLNRQLEKLDAQQSRIDALTASADESLTVAADAGIAEAARYTSQTISRDPVGDLNPLRGKKGDLPGFVLTQRENISVALGGLIKNVAYVDTDAESQGADLLPATFGTGRGDNDGQFAMDATMSRLFLDGWGKAPFGDLNAYVEVDYNGGNDGQLDFKLRHVYGSWTSGDSTLTIGHTWSTVMHMDALPIGLTEPTVSGALFSRQPMIRWQQKVNEAFTWRAAIEDASSNDVFTNQASELGTTKYPDGIVALDFYHGKAHFSASGVVRDIRVDLSDGSNRDTTGWGGAVSVAYRPTESDKLAFYGSYGEALGRYLLGILPADGAAIDPIGDDLETRDNWGGYFAYSHDWNDRWRASLTAGYAESKPLGFQPASTLDNTQYAAANVFWTVLPYLTIGAEYGYGRRENKDGSDIDNHRIMFGVQVF
ncbi:MAG: DcaP family trimeric outer membrane transporter [Gammaproteobacteria bacterium]|nr:DcaP family trimeric outer membrane transporter [Gammaproteobacteria bacterium]